MIKRLHLSGVYLLAVCMLFASAVAAQINVTIQVQSPTCNGFTNGQATAIASGGNGAYSYSWSNGQSGQTTFGIGAGSISVTVTDTDGNTGTRSATVSAPSAITANFVQTGTGTCNLSDGGTITISGGTAPYTLLWDNGQMGTSVSNLGFGVACVRVTDANGCEQIFCYHIERPLSVFADASDVLCPGGCDAVVIARVSGGTPPYTYLWDDGFTGAINDMLLPGTHCVTVTDANGCTARDCGVVGEPAPFAFSFTEVNPACGTNNGSLTASASGGTPPYSYSWVGGPSSATWSGLAAGTYTVNLTDANGCTAQGTATLRSGNLNVGISATSPPCGPGATGTATANVSGGTAPFTYQWSNGATTQSVSGLAPGNYSVTVTDASGCSGTASTTITAGSSLTVTASGTNQTCANTNTGTASANVSGGRAPFTYMWSNGATDPTIVNLAPGTYQVMVSDANGCAGSASVTITAAVPLFCTVTTIQAISAPGANDGILTAQFNGGTMPYTITWSNGMTGQTITGLAPGSYTATVTDGNGCTSTCTGILSEPVNNTLGKIGDFVWRDLNRNGQQDSGEPGVFNVEVKLTRPDATISTTRTDRNGMYCFTDLPAGEYKVTFEILFGSDQFTQANVGNDATDSDAIPMGGPNSQIAMTAPIILGTGDTILTVDAGILDPCIPVTDPGEIEASESSVCGIGADPGVINSVRPAVSTGAIRYLWMTNSIPDPNFLNWANAPGTNNQESYDPGPIYANTYFVRCAFGPGCNVPVETNVVLITVGNTSRAVINGPQLVCENQNYTFEAENAGGGATYSWNFGPSATPQTSNQRSVSVRWSTFGNRFVTLEVTRQGCVTTATQRVAISTCLVPTPFLIESRILGDARVELSWFMVEELETGTYRIQHSADGGDKWSTIGEVEVKPSDRGQSYKFIDEQPKRGYNVYRVVRVLSLGDTFFSDEENVSFFSHQVDMVAYPNPTTNFVRIERKDDLSTDRVVEIIDQTGRIISNVNFPAGQPFIDVSVESATAGMLHMRMKGTDGEVISSLSLSKN